jgi:hypothetical protein
MAVGDGGAWHYQSIMTQKHHRDFFSKSNGSIDVHRCSGNRIAFFCIYLCWEFVEIFSFDR